MRATRRGFLKFLGSAAAALALSRTLPGIGGSAPVVPTPPEKPAIVSDFQPGDIITIEGWYSINPAKRELQQFRIVA